ncbi:hypothetical protein AO275_18160 [Pseudomonas viridiflava]|nr:hypothetical protein AO275_18160 [Pseudomonas viridiflava]
MKPRTRETIVIELTAASDLSRFIERLVCLGKGWAIKPSIYAILRAAKKPEAKGREFTGRTPEINHPDKSSDHSAEHLNCP